MDGWSSGVLVCVLEMLAANPGLGQVQIGRIFGAAWRLGRAKISARPRSVIQIKPTPRRI
jgi:hypothetical protein